ncbi:heme iron utilization protein [Pasteurellaceae bacterium Macca]|nr:heme iron utilization protein [Pasteurellaceae bacterium Macca]
MTVLKHQIAELLAQQPNIITLEIAEQLQRPEGEILCALPDEFVRLFPAHRAEEIFNLISKWGEVTTIIEKSGCIFEIKDQFPHGMIGRGYYNLNMKGEEGALHGHLKLTQIAQIAFISLPFRGKESYNIAFIDHQNHTIFKVYLGRDAQRQLYPHQVEQFNAFQ